MNQLELVDLDLDVCKKGRFQIHGDIGCVHHVIDLVSLHIGVFDSETRAVEDRELELRTIKIVEIVCQVILELVIHLSFDHLISIY